jgi:thiol-disulfide isomerase/thioredoxin
MPSGTDTVPELSRRTPELAEDVAAPPLAPLPRLNPMLTSGLLESKFAVALAYEPYLATAKPNELENWRRFEGQVHLTDTQRRLVAGFARRLNVLVLSGTWCGDCVQQCPMLAAIAAAKPANSPGAPGIDLRFLDRDANPDLADRVRICSGLRVPTAIFINEDFDFLSLMGDRTLSRYRAMAAKRLGAACPLPGAQVPTDEIAATLQDWLWEFERIQLMLRLSPKLRARYGD